MPFAVHSVEGTYTLSVLLALYDHEQSPEKYEDWGEVPCSKDLEKELKTGYQSIKTAVDQLVENGYVLRDKREGQQQIDILLTEKGRAAAKLIQMLESELEILS